MTGDLHNLFLLATKEKDISSKMPNDHSLAFFIEQLDSEPDVFQEVIPFILIE